MTPIPAPIEDSQPPLTFSPPPVGGAQPDAAAAAEAERERLVEEDAARAWHGVPLKPWSEERQRLLDQLTAVDVPLPAMANCDDAQFVHAMFPWAVKALYLALHEPREWERYRPRMLAHIEAWGAGEHEDGERLNVPGDTLTEKAAAVELVMKMVAAHKAVQAMRRVKLRGGRAPEEGN